MVVWRDFGTGGWIRGWGVVVGKGVWMDWGLCKGILRELCVGVSVMGVWMI